MSRDANKGAKELSTMEDVVRPSAWIALRLPSEYSKVIQVIPNTTISLGNYGSFPSNLIIHRPYHLTYEIQDKKPGEGFCRLRVVPPTEIYQDIHAEETASSQSPTASESAAEDEGDRTRAEADWRSYARLDEQPNTITTSPDSATISDALRQTLTQEEIEVLKRHGTGAGKDLIEKLMRSHTAIDQKTAFSLAKYKLFKTKKYIRRFTVLPMDFVNACDWQFGERDATKILEMRQEMIGLLASWGNVHYSGESVFFPDSEVFPMPGEQDERSDGAQSARDATCFRGRWLAVDDSSGLLVAAMAERMGILRQTQNEAQESDRASLGVQSEYSCKQGSPRMAKGTNAAQTSNGANKLPIVDNLPASSASQQGLAAEHESNEEHQSRLDDLHVPFSRNNTITLISSSAQPNLTFLKYFGYDSTLPNPSYHPLSTHLLCITWLQLLDPMADFTYSTPLPSEPSSVLATWKPARRGNYHRKRRRWARTQHIVHATRDGQFAGLVVASTMDPIGILQHTMPLLAGGAPIAIYSPALEPLTQLADCFSVARRAAWAGTGFPPEASGRSVEDLECWEGNDDFPLNPTLVLGAAVQTSRARPWQVLPGRTHPLMTGRGGAEGYVFTGWRAKPAEGKVEARGKFKRVKRGKTDSDDGEDMLVD